MRRSDANPVGFGDDGARQTVSSAATGRPANSLIPASAQPDAHFAVTDGHLTIGTVELIGDVYFAIDPARNHHREVHFADRGGARPPREAHMSTHKWRNLLPIHPAANGIPKPTEEEKHTLAGDLLLHGQRMPVILVRVATRPDAPPQLLDGRTRLDLQSAAGIEVIGANGVLFVPHRVIEVADDDEAERLSLSLNVHRRHLSAEQKTPLIEKLIKANPEKSNRQIAKQTGTSHPYVGKVRERIEEAGDVETLPRRTDSKGRKQPSTKPATKAKRPPAAGLDNDTPVIDVQADTIAAAAGSEINPATEAASREPERAAEPTKTPVDNAKPVVFPPIIDGFPDRGKHIAELKYAVSHRLHKIDYAGRMDVAAYFIAHLVDSYKPEDRRKVIADVRKEIDRQETLISAWERKADAAEKGDTEEAPDAKVARVPTNDGEAAR
jgi:hypothetical protein